MSLSLEIEVIKKFVTKEKQFRYIQFISPIRTRSKFVYELPHFSHFQWELFDKVHKNEVEEIQSRLKALIIKNMDCFVISENSDIDQKVIPFDETLDEIGSIATILVFEDAKMIYFEGEPPKNRYICKIH